MVINYWHCNYFSLKLVLALDYSACAHLVWTDSLYWKMDMKVI